MTIFESAAGALNTEQLAAAIEARLEPLFGFVPGTELDEARAAWREAITIPTNDGTEADMGGARVFSVVLSSSQARIGFSYGWEAMQHAIEAYDRRNVVATDSMMTTALCRATMRALHVCRGLQPLTEVPDVEQSLLDMATFCACLLARARVKDKPSMFVPNSTIFTHIVRPIQRDSPPYLLFASFIRKARV